MAFHADFEFYLQRGKPRSRHRASRAEDIFLYVLYILYNILSDNLNNILAKKL